jgi:hypothetical protein
MKFEEDVAVWVIVLLIEAYSSPCSTLVIAEAGRRELRTW